jgi:hypothetical protein
MRDYPLAKQSYACLSMNPGDRSIERGLFSVIPISVKGLK